MQKKIIIDIAEDGSIAIETKGFAGTACKQATRELEEALGVKTKDTETPEAHTTEKVKVGRWL